MSLIEKIQKYYKYKNYEINTSGNCLDSDFDYKLYNPELSNEENYTNIYKEYNKIKQF